MSDLEPASALAARIHSCVEPHPLTESGYWFNDDDLVELIESDRAAVREPLEKQLSESRKNAEHSHKLYTDLDAEVESALSKLAPFADEGQELTLTELADEAWNSWASTADELKNAAERIASLEALAYVGDHHFPDLTYKARLEELVPKLRELEAQLASAREEALREVLRDLQQFADSFLAEARKAEISGRYDQFSEHARSRALVQTCAQRVRKLLPPPAAQKEPHAR